ncbi:hypothetical protein ACK3TF_001297 [Chlorella vulgaris]
MASRLATLSTTSRAAVWAHHKGQRSLNSNLRLVHGLAKRAAGPSVHVRAASSETSSSSGSSSSSQPAWAIKMLYDGDCPLCMREVDMLRRRDASQGRIAFVDVAAPDYDPAQHGGISFEAAMERIHAVEADGTILTDVEVFRRLYEEVGLGWVYAVTKQPWALNLANKLYSVWAKYRLPITGRPDLQQVLEQKKMCREPPQSTGSGM